MRRSAEAENVEHTAELLLDYAFRIDQTEKLKAQK